MRNTVVRPSAASDGNAHSLSACLARLGEINRQLGQGKLDVEAAIGLYEEGVDLHARADSILRQARLRVQQLGGRVLGSEPEPAPPASDGEIRDPECDLPF
jgi:exodeoxyribonuclease VII small subunit